MLTGGADVKHAHVRRFHLPHAHLESAFGNDWFGLKAEEFARFFGTPTFLVAQTAIVALVDPPQRGRLDAVRHLSIHSSQSRLLDLGRVRGPADPARPDAAGGSRQGARACGRSAPRGASSGQRGAPGADRKADLPARRDAPQNTQLTESIATLIKQNTELTKTVHALVERIETMTAEVHTRLSPQAG